MMEELVEKRPEIIKEADDDVGWTPFHYAAAYRRVDGVKILLKFDISSAAYLLDHDGNSALHVAAFFGSIKVLKELLQSCPDTSELTNKKAQTALHIAVLSNERGFKKAKIESLLEGSSRARLAQHYVTDVFKEWLNRKPEIKPLFLGLRESRERNKNSYLKFPEVFLVVATLVTTVSFSVAFTMPGGYITDGAAKGKPILADKAAFKAFVIFDIVSFFSSVSAVYFQRGTAYGERMRARYQKFQSASLGIAIVALALAFSSGIHVMLANSNRALATAPYAIVCSLLFIYYSCVVIDPFGLDFDIQVSRPVGKYRFEFKCGGAAGRLLPTLSYKIDQSKDRSRSGTEGA